MKTALKIAAGLGALIAVAAYFVYQLPQFGGRFEGARAARMRASPQFIDGRFENIPPQRDGSWLEAIRHYSGGQIREPRFVIPVVALDPVSLKVPPAPGLRATWFGHSTVLLEIDGIRVMTDPVFSEVVSPVPPIGPKRFHRTPLPLNDVAGVDAVVISHDHYDHLDMKSVQHLSTGGTQFFVPLGIGAHLERWGVAPSQIRELDWWEAATVQGVTIHCTPARHYSGRKRMNNATLWSSWMIRGPRHSAYYSGDTGYSPHFAAIRQRLGPTDLALIKVGAYGSAWLDIHMDPEPGMRAAADLEARTVLPVHWATFNLAYHDWDEPILRTLAAARANGVGVITPRIGERFTFGEPFTNTPWYEEQRRRP